jgi:hypothetical protein
MDARTLARGLGWFSVALGVTELVAPGRISRFLGLRDHRALIRSFGVRELGAGAGLLLGARMAPWLWARVAGDVVDLGSLAAAHRASPKPRAVEAALAGVAAVTALDVAAASRLRQKRGWLEKRGWLH